MPGVFPGYRTRHECVPALPFLRSPSPPGAAYDFSQWLRDLGETGLARKIDGLNPYAMTLEK